MWHGICPESQLADCQQTVREGERMPALRGRWTKLCPGHRVLRVMYQVCGWLLLLIVTLPWS